MATAPAADRTKVVIRNLPPLAAESDVRALVDERFKDRVTWFSFVQGKISTKKVVKSYALANFVSPADVVDFKAAVHGHAFVTDRGVKYKCSVEYAPFQRVPKANTKKDPREGTIEEDADFLAFVEKMQEAAPVAPKSILGRAAAPEPEPLGKPEPKVTALMLEVEARRAAKGKSLYNPKAAQRAGTGVYELVHASPPAKESRKAARAAKLAAQTREAESDSNTRRASKDDFKLKKDRSKAAEAAQAAVRAVSGDWHAGEEPAETQPVQREQKAVRMRAGFGVFAPSRVGRLLEEAKDSNDAATAAKAASRPSSRGSSTGADAPAVQAQDRPSSGVPAAVKSAAVPQASPEAGPSMLAAVADAMRTSKPASSSKAGRGKGPAPHQDSSSGIRTAAVLADAASQEADSAKSGKRASADGSQPSRGARPNGRQGSKKEKVKTAKGEWSDEDTPSSAIGVKMGPKAVLKRPVAPG